MHHSAQDRENGLSLYIHIDGKEFTFAMFSILLGILALCGLAHTENWVHSGSFEKKSSRWQFHVRPNMWDFQPAQLEQIIYSDAERSSGKKSMRFHQSESVGQLDRNFALVASQYLLLRNTCLDDSSRTLYFQFRIKSVPEAKVSARLDIRYMMSD